MTDWQPQATIETLRHRAQFLQEIRNFFAKKQVLEVDPPLLSQGVATDPLLNAFRIESREGIPYFLQTSPEYGMKRLLAAGMGAIYSLGKAFRRDEVGRKHNPEFTLLEWYRPDWDHLQLIAEVEALLQHLLDCPKASLVTYQSLFENTFDINPHLAKETELKDIALKNNWATSKDAYDKDGWLDLLLTHGIEPNLGKKAPLVVTDYPASQASLAKVRTIETQGRKYQVASRFEFYYQGYELANGYHELVCSKEQRARFLNDIALRKEKALESLPIDERLLAALEAGMPACAGVALGVDRLFMIKQQISYLEEAMPFAWQRA